jgi:hypothetical protein
MSTKLIINNKTLIISGAKNEMVIASQEKALARQQFEMARSRLLKATRRVQDLKAAIYFGKEVHNEK